MITPTSARSKDVQVESCQVDWKMINFETRDANFPVDHEVIPCLKRKGIKVKTGYRRMTTFNVDTSMYTSYLATILSFFSKLAR